MKEFMEKEADVNAGEAQGQKALALLSTFDADAWFGRPGDADCMVAGDPNGSSSEDFHVLQKHLLEMKQRAQEFLEQCHAILSANPNEAVSPPVSKEVSQNDEEKCDYSYCGSRSGHWNWVCHICGKSFRRAKEVSESADTARLDWLETWSSINLSFGLTQSEFETAYSSLREAIDSAMSAKG